MIKTDFNDKKLAPEKRLWLIKIASVFRNS